ncbi:Bacteriophage P22, Gp10, DNA-stabilising [uncultured Caudovirales phage]|uniref:Bacteriophage P22, Gp10, DNA-stabilising n=1 Tax=uncultured Caudovirales phage TaxID=2100421 RepID=A0A6J5P2X7_9CAUD|nr:Bacteriophage P22, Gp10, DNA-stabilising [uncultured Caudovirales phage]CAB4183659.1 Bacteriophage P22, Gp10, DNA-stabilising [uncultured Caudovirales phage]CAB4214640.1 Bacteriophage P22, Gp10, DNA-stabilising [uncultured Caudovirales phage]CAB4219338.1 Bacteriophage P22, Gp10, DNA-stabilising [uncultured Caudovirales phage]
MKTPILGGAYVARSVNAANNRMVNLFPEAVPEGSGGKEAGFLSRCPGLSLLQTVGTGPIRALWAHQTNGSDFYVVSGSSVYKLTGVNATPTLLGTVTGTGPVSIADNGTQIFFACNPDGYIYNESTNVFAKITDPDFPGAVTVQYLDGYFVFNEPDSQLLWITALLDGTSIDPLDFASAEGSPDGIVAVAVTHRELWVFGTDSVEVWYDAGTADFPLARISGAFNEIGCVAPYSVAKLDNTLYWLGTDARGQGIVYKANGYTGARVSTHAIEYAIQSYSTISDAVAYTYQQDGHAFYVISFPTAGKTWCYDVATNLWHERAGFSNGQFTRHRSNCQCNFGGTIIVGDYLDGRIYSFDLDVYADDDQVQRYLRSWRAIPPGQNNLNRTAQHSLQLDCESGVGLNTGQGSDPQVLLRWSDDGGHTWSNEHARSLGAIGATGQRVIWRRLGMTLKLRDRVYEVSGTDPTKIAIVGAELHASGTKS